VVVFVIVLAKGELKLSMSACRTNQGGREHDHRQSEITGVQSNSSTVCCYDVTSDVAYLHYGSYCCYCC